MNSKLSPEASVFVSKCVLAKKNESMALVSNTIDLGENSLNEDEEDNMLDTCLDIVDREGIYHLGNNEVEATKPKRSYMKINIVGMVK